MSTRPLDGASSVRTTTSPLDSLFPAEKFATPPGSPSPARTIKPPTGSALAGLDDNFSSIRWGLRGSSDKPSPAKIPIFPPSPSLPVIPLSDWRVPTFKLPPRPPSAEPVCKLMLPELAAFPNASPVRTSTSAFCRLQSARRLEMPSSEAKAKSPLEVELDDPVRICTEPPWIFGLHHLGKQRRQQHSWHLGLHGVLSCLQPSRDRPILPRIHLAHWFSPLPTLRTISPRTMPDLRHW